MPRLLSTSCTASSTHTRCKVEPSLEFHGQKLRMIDEMRMSSLWLSHMWDIVFNMKQSDKQSRTGRISEHLSKHCRRELMEKHDDGVNDKTLIAAAEGIIKAFQGIASQVEKTRRLQIAYEGKASFEDYELEGDVDALKAIAAACNAPSESIYAELMRVLPSMRKLRRELDKAKRRVGAVNRAGQERGKAARARRKSQREEDLKGVNALMEFLSGGK